jgi:hypothetical protein
MIDPPCPYGSPCRDTKRMIPGPSENLNYDCQRNLSRMLSLT